MIYSQCINRTLYGKVSYNNFFYIDISYIIQRFPRKSTKSNQDSFRILFLRDNSDATLSSQVLLFRQYKRTDTVQNYSQNEFRLLFTYKYCESNFESFFKLFLVISVLSVNAQQGFERMRRQDMQDFIDFQKVCLIIIIFFN